MKSLKLKFSQFFTKPMIQVFFVFLVFKLIFAYTLFIVFEFRPINLVEEKFSKNVISAVQAQNVPRKTIPPEYVRGIYLTAYSASRTDWIDRLIKRITDGGVINTVIIDIKDYTGYVLYNSELENLKELDLINPIAGNIQEVIKKFHEAGIYVIARQTVFQDPALAEARPDLALKKTNGTTWYNYNGLAFTDPQNREVWDYNIEIAKEAVSLGFDEINFDYVRYPSDGNLKTIDYGIPEDKKRADVMEDFFAYLSEKLTPIVNISVDLFGMVMDNVDNDYDLGIGQRLERTVDYFDYVCPMMYPSHYPYKYLGVENPAVYPGLVIEYGINKADYVFAGKRASVRPWLQAFNIGAVYDKAKIDAQTIAAESATSTGWLLWNARNYYEDHIFEP